jgi:hypothetical protein
MIKKDIMKKKDIFDEDENLLKPKKEERLKPTFKRYDLS